MRYQEEDENVKSCTDDGRRTTHDGRLHDGRRTTDENRTAIAHSSLRLRWAKKSQTKSSRLNHTSWCIFLKNLGKTTNKQTNKQANKQNQGSRYLLRSSLSAVLTRRSGLIRGSLFSCSLRKVSDRSRSRKKARIAWNCGKSVQIYSNCYSLGY